MTQQLSQPPAAHARPEQWVGAPLIDTDVHVNPDSLATLFPYLDARWCDYITESGMGGVGSTPICIRPTPRPCTSRGRSRLRAHRDRVLI